MASPTEFLTKQLNIEKEIVTFRRLSRALSIHVNAAKNELAFFHASSRTTDESVHATFLLTGDIAPVKAHGPYRDEREMEVDDDESEMVPSTRIILVSEPELEAAKAQFMRPPSVHIYSLSPSAITDAALLVPIADDVRAQHATKGKEFHQMVGTVVGADVKIKTFASKKLNAGVVGSSKLHPPPQEKKTVDTPKGPDIKAKVMERPKEMKKGILDWSKAKSKSEKEEANTAKQVAKPEKKKGNEKAMTKKESEEKGTAMSNKESKVALKRQDSKTAVKMETEESEADIKKENAPEKPKRGRKRPSAVMALSDSEEDQDNNPAPKAKPRTSGSPRPSKPSSTSESRVKVKNGALISDDEDETPVRKSESRQKGKGKSRAMLSDDEDERDRSVRAIMDLDDSQFIRHQKPSAEPRAEEEEAEAASDVVSDSEPLPARIKPKRKPKKVIPVGRNGLPKKRVVKSRKSKDARGYMITQDYSSYESVSESEQAPAASEVDKKSSKRRNNSKKEDSSTSGTLAASKAHLKSRHSNKSTTEESSAERSKPTQTDGDERSDFKQTSSGSGGGTKSNSAKTSNGNKKNLMNYFGKK